MRADRSIYIDQPTLYFIRSLVCFFFTHKLLYLHRYICTYTYRVCVYIYVCTHTLTGEPIDERGPINAKHSMSIHADAPSFAEQSTEAEILVTGIKVLRIFLCRLVLAG